MARQELCDVHKGSPARGSPRGYWGVLVKKPDPVCKQCGACCRVFAVRKVIKTKYIIEYAAARGYWFDGSTLLIPSVCPKLTEDGKCSIYEIKPQICGDYNGKDPKYYVPIGCVFRK